MSLPVAPAAAFANLWRSLCSLRRRRATVLLGVSLAPFGFLSSSGPIEQGVDAADVFKPEL